MFEFIGTLKTGGLAHESFQSKGMAIAWGQTFCESFEVLDNDGYQVYNEFPRTQWV